MYLKSWAGYSRWLNIKMCGCFLHTMVFLCVWVPSGSHFTFTYRGNDWKLNWGGGGYIKRYLFHTTGFVGLHHLVWINEFNHLATDLFKKCLENRVLWCLGGPACAVLPSQILEMHELTGKTTFFYPEYIRLQIGEGGVRGSLLTFYIYIFKCLHLKIYIFWFHYFLLHMHQKTTKHGWFNMIFLLTGHNTYQVVIVINICVCVLFVCFAIAYIFKP